MLTEIISETISPESQPTRDQIVVTMAAAEAMRALEGIRARRALIVEAVQPGGVASWRPHSDKSGGFLSIGVYSVNLPLDQSGFPILTLEAEQALVDAMNARVLEARRWELNEIHFRAGLSPEQQSEKEAIESQLDDIDARDTARFAQSVEVMPRR